MKQAFILFLCICFAFTVSCGGESDQELETANTDIQQEIANPADTVPESAVEDIRQHRSDSIFCNSIMDDIALTELFYWGISGHFTTSIRDLYGTTGHNISRCPGCNEDCVLEISEDGYTCNITCPAGHGNTSVSVNP